LIPWVEEPVMVTPEVVGLVGIVWLKDELDFRTFGWWRRRGAGERGVMV
jgi:hypothetical protein